MADRNVLWTCSVLVFHVLCTLVGLAAFVIGFYVYWNSSKYSSGLNNCSIPFIVIAILVTCLHACGFCTVHRNNKTCYRILFTIILLVMAIVLAVTAGSIYYVKGENLYVVMETIEKHFENAYRGSSEEMLLVDALQIYGECCGTDGLSFWLKKQSLLPQSCCKGNAITPCIATNAYKVGCKEKAKEIFGFFIDLIIISVLVLAVFEVISAVIVAFFKKRTSQKRNISYLPVIIQYSNPIIS